MNKGIIKRCIYVYIGEKAFTTYNYEMDEYGNISIYIDKDEEESE